MLSRRSFLGGAPLAAASTLARLSPAALALLSESARSAHEQKSSFQVLSAEEARDFEAIAARIIPTTDSPGAREAGVIYFIDRAFGSFHRGDLEGARAGYRELVAGLRRGHFADLDEAAQDAYLRQHEHSAFFELLRFMTICGFFGMSSYGGNRNSIGWTLLGMEAHAHGYTFPFGYYDAEYRKEHPNG
jgi:gluconate 2-dehydrogenase gamma chain